MTKKAMIRLSNATDKFLVPVAAAAKRTAAVPR